MNMCADIYYLKAVIAFSTYSQYGQVFMTYILIIVLHFKCLKINNGVFPPVYCTI